MAERKARVDDLVHYYAEGNPRTGPFEARVTEIEDERATLEVTFPTAKRIKQGVPFSTSPLKHHWCWPPAR